MSENLYKLFTAQFSTNLQLRLQQQGSLLRGKVAEGFHVGRQASPIDYEGPIQSRTPAGRFAPMGRVDADFMRRWLVPQEKELPQLIDSFDKLQTIQDPQSKWVENASNAFGRDWDDAIIASAFGTAQIGDSTGVGLSSETFASAATTLTTSSSGMTVADTFGAGGSVGLTIPKFIEFRRLFRHFHVSEMELSGMCLIIGSTQEADLLNLAQVQSTEFNPKPTIVDGKVTRLYGADIIVSERLNVASNIRDCIAFVKGGLYLGIWQDQQHRVSIRNDLSSEPYQLYSKHMFGASRLEPGRCLKVQAADTVGADINP